MAEIMGGRGVTVNTVGDFRKALQTAKNTEDTFILLDVKLDEKDISPALRTFGESFGNFVEASAVGKIKV